MYDENITIAKFKFPKNSCGFKTIEFCDSCAGLLPYICFVHENGNQFLINKKHAHVMDPSGTSIDCKPIENFYTPCPSNVWYSQFYDIKQYRLPLHSLGFLSLAVYEEKSICLVNENNKFMNIVLTHRSEPFIKCNNAERIIILLISL